MEPIIIRGGGDLATGTIHCLCKSGYSVIILECERPSAIRRKVSFCQAVYDGQVTVEGITCIRVKSIEEALLKVSPLCPVLLVDTDAKCLETYRPEILIDGILAKKNLGTNRNMARLTIALGPGFEAGKDVDYVIETKRGHYLGRVIEEGMAIANTGIPGIIGGYGKERVIHTDVMGTFYPMAQIGDWVKAGQQIGYVMDDAGEKYPVNTAIGGVLRGILQEGYPVKNHFKAADVDPRKEAQKHCDMISDKARCIAGSVLSLVVAHEKKMR